MDITESHLPAYLADLKDRNLSEHSIRGAKAALTGFFSSYSVLNQETLTAYHRSFNKATTANKNMQRVRALAHFNAVDINVKPRKEPPPFIDAFRPSELEQLCEAVEQIDVRTAALIGFMADTGLRSHEVFQLRKDSIQYEDGTPFIKVIGKGSKPRVVPLTANAKECFGKIHFPLTMSERTLRRHLAKYARSAGMRHVHPHKLRKSCASNLLNRGVDSVHVLKMHGWENANVMLKHYYKPTVKGLSSNLGFS